MKNLNLQAFCRYGQSRFLFGDPQKYTGHEHAEYRIHKYYHQKTSPTTDICSKNSRFRIGLSKKEFTKSQFPYPKKLS